MEAQSLARGRWVARWLSRASWEVPCLPHRADGPRLGLRELPGALVCWSGGWAGRGRLGGAGICLRLQQEPRAGTAGGSRPTTAGWWGPRAGHGLGAPSCARCGWDRQRHGGGRARLRPRVCACARGCTVPAAVPTGAAGRVAAAAGLAGRVRAAAARGPAGPRVAALPGHHVRLHRGCLHLLRAPGRGEGPGARPGGSHSRLGRMGPQRPQ